jgi:hypothetical protein
LGDAAEVSTIRVEWPSGVVQEINSIAAKQILTITEPLRIETIARSEADLTLTLNGQTSRRYSLQGSTNLMNWADISQERATNAVICVGNYESETQPYRFYRAVAP